MLGCVNREVRQEKQNSLGRSSVRWEMVKLWVMTVGFERENVDRIPEEELLNITHYPVNETIGD